MGEAFRREILTRLPAQRNSIRPAIPMKALLLIALS